MDPSENKPNRNSHPIQGDAQGRTYSGAEGGELGWVWIWSSARRALCVAVLHRPEEEHKVRSRHLETCARRVHISTKLGIPHPHPKICSIDFLFRVSMWRVSPVLQFMGNNRQNGKIELLSRGVEKGSEIGGRTDVCVCGKVKMNCYLSP